MSDLKTATKRALLWSAFEKIGQQGIFFVVVAFTGRLLSPEDFGLVGALTIFTALSNLLSDSGLSLAIIRKTDADEEDYNTVFYFNMLVSVVLYLTLFFCAPLIADFYGQPQIMPIARVLFLSVVIYAFGVIQSAQLVKQMRFKDLTIANIVSYIGAGTVSVAMAFAGCGPWALVAQAVVLAAVKTLMLWILCGWRPKMIFSRTAFFNMFGFSSKLLAGSVVSSLTSNFYSFIIGRYMPIYHVGYYTQANKMKEMGSSMIWSAFGTSTYTMLSNLQNDPERLRKAMRKTMRTVAFVTFPIMLGIAVVASPLVNIVISDKWAQSIPYFQMLCVGAVFFILSANCSNFIKISGRSDISLGLDILNAALLVGFLFLTIGYGLGVAIVSDVVSKIIVYFVYAGIVSRQFGYRVTEQFRDVLPYAAIGVAMVAAAWPLGLVIKNDYLLLVSQIAVGGIVYVGVAKLFGSVILDEVLQTVTTFLKRR